MYGAWLLPMISLYEWFSIRIVKMWSNAGTVAVAALGEAPWLARRRAYDGLAKVSFDGMWYRSDIGPRPGSRPESDLNGNREPGQGGVA